MVVGAVEALTGHGLAVARQVSYRERAPDPGAAVWAAPRVSARLLVRLGVLLWRQAVRRSARAGPGPPGAWTWTELGNRLRVFDAFHHPDSYLPGGSATEQPGLAARVEAAGRLPADMAVWVLEGLGYAAAESKAVGRAPAVRDRLTTGRIPESAWMPLHTGQGLSLAARYLDQRVDRRADRRAGLGPQAAPAAHFASLALGFSLAGYGRATFEALGFAAVTLAPDRVGELDRELDRDRPDLLPWFWHGVGRGLYFCPSSAWPGAAGYAARRAWCEPPHELGRANALAGLAWAVTLVNLGHPEVVARLLESLPAGSARRVAIRGVANATALWLDARGFDPLLNGFLDPPWTGAAAKRWGERWRATVTGPCQRAFDRYRSLKSARRLDSLFALTDT